MADNGAFTKKNFIRDGKSKSDITSYAILAHILLEILIYANEKPLSLN